MIDRQALNTRIEQLEADRTQTIAKLQALTGALQDCEYWLSQIESEESADG
jgi:hypothetical protein